MNNILHVHSSGRGKDSFSRQVGAKLVKKLCSQNPGSVVTDREAAEGARFLDEEWIEAKFTPVDGQTRSHKSLLEYSEILIEELIAADHIVIDVAMYNFGIPAALKAWIDQAWRPGRTFKMDENGFSGLLKNKRAYLIVTSGGTPIQGPMDFATNYLIFALNFIGITDVEVIAVPYTDIEQRETVLANAYGEIEKMGEP